MKNYFAFNCDISDTDGGRNFRFLFKSPGALRDGDLADAIELSALEVLVPDGIAIVCMPDEVNDVLNGFKNLASLKEAANRLKTRISLCVCSIDGGGRILLKGTVCNPERADKIMLRSSSKDIFSTGLSQLFAAHHVLVSAPPGFTFVKPSGERSTQFLRAEDALNEVENVQFLSFALLAKIQKRESLLKQHIEVIYIDSMAIAAVAYALRELYCVLYDAPRPRVVSFHSHIGLKDFDFPLFGTSFCIISASQSMRLERLWIEKSRCHSSEIVTLLTAKNAVGRENALHALSLTSYEKETTNELRDIRIAGERFAPEELKPKKVLLRKDIHYVKSAERFAKLFTGDTILSIQGRGDVATSKIRPLFVNGLLLSQTKQFQSFLTKVLEQKVPASIRAIVYQNDSASKNIAEKCASELKIILRTNCIIPLISHNEISTFASNHEKSASLLIIAAVVGRGTELLSISRDLRPIHIGARTYLIGAQVSETRSQIVSLERNLKFSSVSASIDISTFSSIAIGVSLQSSFKSEYKVISALELSTFEDVIAQRPNKISGTENGLVEDALLPSGLSLDQKLFLRPDFAYWKFPYDEHKSNTPAVLMTAAAILQNARESMEISTFNRLGTDAFQQVIIDPENFARYNDGIIQSAILRTTLPGELDYSSEQEASRFMLDLLSKIFTHCDTPLGEAALEFALAIKSNRLKLTKEDTSLLNQRIEYFLQGELAIKRLLRVLLSIEKPDDQQQLPSEF